MKAHKIQYYLERRDPEFKAKMIEVLHVYRDVELWRKAGLPSEVVGVLSYDEKPGILLVAVGEGAILAGRRAPRRQCWVAPSGDLGACG